MDKDKANWLFLVAWAKYKPDVVMNQAVFDMVTWRNWEQIGYVKYVLNGNYAIAASSVIKKANQRA